jgi:hypothetical protein
MTLNLRPFESNTETQEIRLSANVVRSKDMLNCRFELIDSKRLIRVPDVKSKPVRVKGLWNSTCFEVFWKNLKESSYWELNVSPSLNWNVYSFLSYRSDVEKEDFSFKSINSSIEKENSFATSLILSFNIDLDNCNSKFQDIAVSCAAVLEHRSGIKSYWAFKHPSSKPDFHHVESFIKLE